MSEITFSKKVSKKKMKENIEERLEETGIPDKGFRKQLRGREE